jgi:TPR repeat protein
VVEAVKWYRKAADLGHPHAQFNLGSMYAKGQGVPQDYALAYVWFDLAASRFPVSERESANRNRDHVASRMTPAQIAEAQKVAREWKPRKER